MGHRSEDIAAGRVRLALLPLAVGSRAEPLAADWLATQLGCTPAGLGLVRDARGRPRLGLPGHDCSWSHSGGWLAVALGTGVAVGIDIEHPRPRPRAVELAQRFFEPTEAAAVAAAAQPEAVFLRLWCAKEAVLKAHGHGLAFGLDRLRFQADGPALRLAAADPALGPVDRWHLAEPEWPGLRAAVAWRED